MKNKQLAFLMEGNRCIGCGACKIACKDKNSLGDFESFRNIIEIGKDSDLKEGINLLYRSYLSIACNHCMNPICVEVCPTGAMEKDEESGIVLVNRELCIGCRKCMKSCPYDAIVFDSTIRKVKKCDFCIDLIKRGEKPICVGACPVRALDFAYYKDLEKENGSCDYVKGLAEPKTNPALILKLK